MSKHRRTSRVKNNLLVYLLAGITVISSGISICLLAFYLNNKPIIPDYMPVEQDQYVVTLPDEVDNDPMEVPEDGGGAIVICDTEITAHLDTGKIDMDYRNPVSSASAVVLQLLIGDKVVSQSGSIYPGYKLQDMQLLENVKLQEGGYYGIIKIAFYDPNSGEKALVDTDIEVSVNVVP